MELCVVFNFCVDAVRMRPHLCNRLSEFVCLFDFGTSSWVKSKLGQQCSWGVGSFIQGGRCKKGCGFQKPRPFWSAVQCLGNQTAVQKNSRKSWTVISLLIPDNADAICRHKLWNLRTWCTWVRYCVHLFLLHVYTEMLIINKWNNGLLILFLFARYSCLISEMFTNQRWRMFIDLMYVLHLCTPWSKENALLCTAKTLINVFRLFHLMFFVVWF